MEKQEQIITTYQQIIQKTELELQNARKRIYIQKIFECHFGFIFKKLGQIRRIQM